MHAFNALGVGTRRSRRVVVIEDDTLMQDFLRTLLEAEGYRVLSAAYPPTPVDISQLRPEFVVLDLRLSGAATGWHLLQELKVTPGATGIPVLVCTGDHELVRRNSHRLRRLATAIVLKPFDVDTWSSAVEACQNANMRSATRASRSRAGAIVPSQGAMVPWRPIRAGIERSWHESSESPTVA